MTPAFLFPGQGAQTCGHGARSGGVVAGGEACSSIVREILGYDLGQICFEGPTEKLDSTAYSQPACSSHRWRRWKL